MSVELSGAGSERSHPAKHAATKRTAIKPSKPGAQVEYLLSTGNDVATLDLATFGRDEWAAKAEKMEQSGWTAWQTGELVVAFRLTT